MTGNGNLPGRNAFSARRSSTIESLPPEKSSTGRSSSAATSRMMWIASASSSSRCESVACAASRVMRAPPAGSRAPRAPTSSGRAALGLEPQLRRLRLLVRVGDAGELGDLAAERLLVEALHVAARALLDRGRDVHLDERRELLDQRARPCRASRRTARSPRRAPSRRGARAARRPSRSARCSCRGPPSRSRGPSRGASRTTSPSRYSTSRPSASSSRPTSSAIVDLPAPERPVNQSTIPSGTDLAPGAPVAVDAALELAEPAQRPARSSSPGWTGRVHGMQPIDG